MPRTTALEIWQVTNCERANADRRTENSSPLDFVENSRTVAALLESTPGPRVSPREPQSNLPLHLGSHLRKRRGLHRMRQRQLHIVILINSISADAQAADEHAADI